MVLTTQEERPETPVATDENADRPSPDPQSPDPQSRGASSPEASSQFAQGRFAQGGFAQGRERPLQVRGEDAEDLAVIASFLQDAVVNVGEMAYVPEESRFVLMAHRYRWETHDPEAEQGERVTCGICFEAVTRVRFRGFSRRNLNQVLNLLTIHPDDQGILLVFAAGAQLHLTSDRLCCFVEDRGLPWPTHFCPCHDLD